MQSLSDAPILNDELVVDVAITYKPVAAQSAVNTTFDDLVEYRKLAAADNSAPSTSQSSSRLQS